MPRVPLHEAAHHPPRRAPRVRRLSPRGHGAGQGAGLHPGHVPPEEHLLLRLHALGLGCQLGRVRLLGPRQVLAHPPALRLRGGLHRHLCFDGHFGFDSSLSFCSFGPVHQSLLFNFRFLVPGSATGCRVAADSPARHNSALETALSDALDSLDCSPAMFLRFALMLSSLLLVSQLLRSQPPCCEPQSGCPSLDPTFQGRQTPARCCPL